MSVIQPNELRVGNLLQRPEKIRSKLLDGDFIYFMVDAYMIRDCQHYKENWAFEGIPLTPEILEKAGFVNLGKGVLEEPYWQIHKFISLWKVGGNTSMYQLCCADKMLPCLPEYLHHLQNITHALTGQELTIKL